MSIAGLPVRRSGYECGSVLRLRCDNARCAGDKQEVREEGCCCRTGNLRHFSARELAGCYDNARGYAKLCIRAENYRNRPPGRSSFATKISQKKFYAYICNVVRIIKAALLRSSTFITRECADALSPGSAPFQVGWTESSAKLPDTSISCNNRVDRIISDCISKIIFLHCKYPSPLIINIFCNIVRGFLRQFRECTA